MRTTLNYGIIASAGISIPKRSFNQSGWSYFLCPTAYTAAWGEPPEQPQTQSPDLHSRVGKRCSSAVEQVFENGLGRRCKSCQRTTGQHSNERRLPKTVASKHTLSLQQPEDRPARTTYTARRGVARRLLDRLNAARVGTGQPTRVATTGGERWQEHVASALSLDAHKPQPNATALSTNANTNAHEATARNAGTTPNTKAYANNGDNASTEAESTAQHADYQSTLKRRSTSGTPTTEPPTKAQNTSTATAQTADAEGVHNRVEPVDKPVRNPHPGAPKTWSDQTAGEVALMRGGFKHS